MKTNFRLLITFLMLLGLGISQSAWGETVRIYCKMTQSWWTSGSAAISIHYWGGTSGTTWPGAMMTQDGTSGLWYIDVDKALLKNFKFARVNPNDPTKYWGAQTSNLTLQSGGENLYTITNTTSCWTDGCYCSGSWSKYAPTGAIIGSWNSWNPATNQLSSGSVTIHLTASTTPYEFKVLYGTDYYGNNGTMYRNNCSGWTMETGKNNCKILADKTGDYVFAWNNSTKKLSVTYAESSTRIIYLDYSEFTDWAGGTSGFKVGDYNGADKQMTKVNDCGNDYLYSAQVGTIDINYVFKRISANTGKALDSVFVVVTGSNNACKITGWKAGSASTITRNYTVKFNKNGHGADVADRCVADGQSTTDPELTESGYICEGWFTNSELTNQFIFGTTTITEPTTLYAKWTEPKHTVSVAVNDAHMGQVNVASVTGVGAVTKSAAITATPKAGCYFTGWTIPEGVTLAEGTTSSATIKINATADDKTITATFAGRYAFRGSLNISGGPQGGMPGWGNNDPVPFNDVWEGQGHVTFTLLANKTYKFKLRDLTQNKYAGFATSGQYLEFNGAWTQMNGESGQDVLFTTRGAGNYEFLFGFNSYTPSAYCTPKVKSNVAFTSYQIPFGVNDANMGTVTAMANDSSFTNNQWVAQGDKVVFTATPQANYEVEGWYTDAACTQGKHDAGATTYTINNIQAAETVYVKFQPQSYTITYKDQGDVAYSGSNIDALPQKHTYGTVTNLVNGAKAGYTFDGWFESSDCTGDPVSSIGATAKTADFTLYAKWTQSLVYYAITKGVNDANMGTVTSNAENESQVLAGTVVTFTAAPNAGFEVEGWYTNSECTEGKSDAGQLNHSVTMDANKTVYVKFKYIDYTVTTEAKKPEGCSPTIGSITTSQDLTKVHHGVSFSITATPTVLSRFMGWTSSDNSKVTFENANSATTNVTVTGNNVTIYANFDGRYAMRGGYKDKEGTGGMPGLTNTTPIYGTTWGDVRYTLEANTAYAFRLVDLADSEQNYGMPAASGIAGTINLDNDYFTTFVAGNITYLTTRGAGSYQFQLCATNEAPFYPRMKVVATGTQPLSLQIPYGVNDAVMGSISATANGVAFDKNKWVATGDNVVFTAAPNTGYEVEGWYTNAACTEGKHDAGATAYTINNIQAAQTVYVKFAGSTYNIIYKDQDDAEFSGVHVSGYPTTHTYGTATELKTATKTGYIFEGWYADADCTGTAVTSLGATAYTGDITLYAKWKTAEVIKVYYYNRYDWNGVRYMAYDGTAPGTGWPGPLAALTDTTHDGHTIYRVTFYEGEYNKIQFSEDGHSTNQTARMFNVANHNGECVIFDKTVKPDSCWWGTLPTQNYLVTFDVQGHGTAPAAVWVDKDAKVTAPADPSEEGYTFGGWYKEAGCTNAWDFSNDVVTGTTTIFAKWTPIQYTITYNTNGGVAVPQGSYTIETPTFSLPTTTKTGAVFDGWYDNAELTGTAVAKITIGSTGNKTFWAKWTSKHAYLEGRARVKTGENTYTKVSDSDSEWSTSSKNIEFTYNTAASVYYLNLNQTVGEVEAYTVGGEHHYFRVGVADGDDGAVTCLGVTDVENDYEYTTSNKSATLLANADKSAWFNASNEQAPNVLAGPVMLKYDPTNMKLAYCAPVLTFSYAGDLNTLKGYTIELEDASTTPTGLTDAAIIYQYKLGDGAWTTWSSDIVAEEGTYKLRATASGNNEFGQAVTGVVSNEITVTVTTPAIEAKVTHVNDVATDNPVVRVNDNFIITPTVTNVPEDQTIQVCYKWITIPAGSAIDKSKNIFEQVGETSAAKVAIDVAGDYKIRVFVTSSNVCPDLGIKWDSTDVDVHVKGDEITVYAKVDKGITDWNNKYIYYWKGDAKAKAWPGSEMTYIGKDSVDYEWYSYNIVGYKAYQGGNLLFNDGTEQYGQYQTNNVAMPNDDEFYFIKTAIEGGKRNVATDPHIDVTKRVILMTDTTALYQYVTIKVEGKGIFFANREDMTYTYTLTSKPDGSTATLNQKHQLTPDKAGNYIVTIRCEAGSLNAENTYVLRVQPNPVTLTASAASPAAINATTTLTVASSQSIGGLYKTFTVIEPGTNDPITFQSGTKDATSSAYTLRSSGTYTFAVVLTDNEGVIAGKAQCALTVNPKGIWLSQNNQPWTQMTYRESDGVYTESTLTFYTGHDAYLSKDNKEWHMGVLNPDNLASGSACLWVYDVTTDQVTVYALNKRLYRIKSVCDDNTYYSNAITNDGESISFFAEKGGQLIWQERATAAAEWEDQSVVVTTTATENGIYTATPTIKAASFTLTAYTGTLTVFSQLTKNDISTGTPTAASGQLTEFTKASAAEYYNHYWVRYISTNNAQAMATVGNSINNCLATTLPYYEMPATANVRYAYDNTTNHFSRTFLAGSDDANFLRVYGEHLDTLVAGSDPKQYTPISSLESSKKFNDGSDWIYTANASGDVNSTQSVTAKLVTKYNNTQRWILAESGLEADEDAKRVVLNQNVATPGRYNLTLIYDFKTNRLTAGAQPEPGTVISDTMLIDQLILTREGDGDATQFTLADQAKLIVVDKMTVELDVTKAMWTAWEDNTTGGGYKIMYFWFSIPYECHISDIYGLGVYGTKFEIQRYRGDLRASGEAGSSTGKSAWRKLKATATMEANRGYVVALRVCESDFKSAGDKQIVRLFFPSVGKVELKHEVTTVLAEYEDSKTSNLHWNWNIMGNPLVKTDEGDLIIDTEHEGAAELNYIYVWQWNGGARTYEPWALEETTLQSTHSYMVQGKGTVYWKYPTAASAPMRYLEAAHYASEGSYGKLNLRLNISKDDQLLDKTYIRYREDGSRKDYEIGRDLEKIINTGYTQMYAVADNNLAAICLNSEDSAMIPLTVIANKDGNYAISLHRQLNSNLEPTIYDAATGEYTNLSLSEFTTSLKAGTYTNRFFFLMKNPGSVTNLRELNSNNFGEGVHKIIMNEQLYIIRDGIIYDARGGNVK